MGTQNSRSQDSEDTELDRIGLWSEQKHEILKKYAVPYSTILAKQRRLKHCYIDAFSGMGEHISRETGLRVKGSPLHALDVTPPFHHYYFIDLEDGCVEHLRSLASDRQNVTILNGDSNVVLIDDVFSRVRYEDWMRALCFLDPKGLHLAWDVVETAGQMKSIELFVNFPLMDINRNLVRDNPKTISEQNIARMDRYWGDHSWYDVIYESIGDLFESEVDRRKAVANTALVKAYQERLRTVAGFKCVPKPVFMYNSIGRALYCLFFASYNDVGLKIVNSIFDDYRRK